MKHELISDTLKWIQEGDFHSDTFLTSEENALFFASKREKQPKVEKTIYTSPVPKAKVVKEERQTPPPPIVKSEPPPKQEKSPPDSIRKLIEKVHPYYPLTDQIPDDAIAKSSPEKEAGAQVVILYFGEASHDLDFLKKLARAIHTSYAPTKLIDARRLTQEKKWDQFLTENNYKLIISPEKGLQTSFELMRRYTEIPKTGARFLGKIPLLLLTALDQYEKNPHLKRTLWSTLCQILKK